MKTKAFCVLSILAAQAFVKTAAAQPATLQLGGGASADPSGVQGNGNANATPASSGAPPAVAETKPNDEWAERDRKLGESPTLVGGVGLLHMPFAQGGAAGQFRVAFTAETFSADFLCTSAQSCRNPRGAGRLNSASLSHIGGTLSLDVQIAKWLEAYGSTGGFANSSDANRPSLIQVLGDTQLGVKVHTQIGRVFHVGFSPELWLVNGTGSVGLLGGGTSAKFRGLATVDLRDMQKSLPVRFGTTLTYSIDNTGETLTDIERLRGEPVTRIERFGLRVNRVDHFDIHLGAEVFLLKERLRPFMEYGIAIPVNRQGYACRVGNPSQDKCMANDPIAPSSLTIGARAMPWKNGFALTAAFDIGVTGTSNFIEEMSPVAPWTFYLGAGWAFDTKDRPPVETIKMVDRPVAVAAKGSLVTGFVHEAEKTEGISNAIISWDEHPQWTSLATGTDGRFTTHELEGGTYGFTVKAEGYKPGNCKVTLAPGVGGGPGAAPVQVDCPVQALPRVGAIVGHVKDETGAVRGAMVKVVDAQKKPLSGSGDDSGAFRFGEVSPGTAQITVDAEGYLSYVGSADVKARQDNAVDIVLQKRPKNAQVTVGKNEIGIKNQIQFALDSAQILPASTGLLTEIADVFIHNPQIKRVEVQGHTDNSGTADHNKQLSEDRANAVVKWLADHGVDNGRLVARGYGQGKPLVPNVTAANRARNRRVQFIIVDQDAAAAAPAAPVKAGAGDKATKAVPKK